MVFYLQRQRTTKYLGGWLPLGVERASGQSHNCQAILLPIAKQVVLCQTFRPSPSTAKASEMRIQALGKK